MFTHSLLTVRRSILASLVLAALAVATLTLNGVGQTESKSRSAFEGLDTAGAIISADQNFEA